jgi:hypothetical protein
MSNVLSGLCISKSGIDLHCISSKGGSFESSGNEPLYVMVLASLSTSLAALFSAHPSELTVLTLPTQLNARERYLIEATVKAEGINSRLVFDHIDAYISRMTLTELTPDTRIFLFVEGTPTNFTARLLNIRHQGSQRIQHPIRTHTVSGNSFSSLVELIGQVIAWMQLQNYKLSRVVFLDIDRKTARVALSHITIPCPVFHACGADLARYAAAYAFAHAEELREPDDPSPTSMGMTIAMPMAPSPISILTADGTPLQIVPGHDCLPIGQSILLTTARDNQSRVAVELVLGNHTAEICNVFSKVVLDGLKPMPKGQPRIWVTVMITAGQQGSKVEVLQEIKGAAPAARIEVQLPSPFVGLPTDKIQSYVRGDQLTHGAAIIRALPED